MVLALGDLLAVAGPRCRIAQGGERGEKESPFELPVPPGTVVRRGSMSPRSGSSGRVRHRRPDGRRSAAGKALPSPTSIRTRAPVLTPTPGIDVRTFEEGWSSSGSPIRPAGGFRWSSMAGSEATRPGRTSAAAFPPKTATISSSDAAKTSSSRRSAILGAFGRGRVAGRRRPASRLWAGDPNRSSGVRTAGRRNRGPRTRSSEGRIWASSPYGRFATRTASPGAPSRHLHVTERSSGSGEAGAQPPHQRSVDAPPPWHHSPGP
ncbi:hypothetical protein HNR61_008660 [Actinomadura namibiensis]|uniref:Uncharacterized protein n=1 Tax=Actinomadura namibiensis TaxID=182080 RepID=A0A7W3LZC2_ACTNM|nr:hypothetical protein [Actinomadura namibiensis]